MALGRQFLLLLWKNWTLQKRKVCVTVFELLLPLSFGTILVLIRLDVKTTDNLNNTIWPTQDFTSDTYIKDMYVNPDILYAPNETVINNIMAVVLSSVNNQMLYEKTLLGFKTEGELLEYYNLHNDTIWAAVAFDPSQSYVNSLPDDVLYDLRVARLYTETRWNTDYTYDFAQTTSPRTPEANDGGPPDYVETGFLYLQYEVDRAIIKQKSGKANFFDDINVKLKKMPYPPYVEDTLLPTIETFLPLFLMLGFMLYAIQTTKNIVYEKERKLKESMKMMGLSTVVYWMSWFVSVSIYLVIACFIFTLSLSVKFNEYGSYLPHSDPTLTFVFLLCFAMSVTALSFMISTFFKKANTAAFAGGVIYFLKYFPNFLLSGNARYASMTQVQKILASLFSDVAMAFGVKTIAEYEGTGEGARWSNFHKPPTVNSNFSLLTSMIMMLSDTALYLLVMWYVDAIMPGEFGVPEPFYFPFTKTYWCGSSKTVKMDRQVSVVPQDETYFERDPTHLRAGISICHLRKVFRTGQGKKVAVRDTTLNMYEGQITALLGHNGAGKTTTMSMLTGFIPPSSGTAKVNGYDIRKDITAVRNSLGHCPQHNILFDNLTVEEHLRFFAKLKGCPSDTVQKEVNEMIGVLDLEAKRHKFSSTLSGGQKRKLSVGIALIAGSKIVILDEPTSGMDPGARRQTWDILQKFKEGRTVVLSTHFMDEADVLGDRIAIMSEGVVKCCGSSYFLKKAYGAGYHLVMVKDKTCVVSRVTELVQSHVTTASLQSEISAELSYLLPFDESANFESLLLEIESKSEDLGISSFGTTATTMEEVFLKVGETSEIEEEMVDKAKLEGTENSAYQQTSSETKSLTGHAHTMDGYRTAANELVLSEIANDNFIAFNKDVKKNYGTNLIIQQFFGMFMKKMIHTLRNHLVTGVQLIVPVIFTIMALSIEFAIPKVKDEPPLTLNLQPFGNGLTELYYSGDEPTNFTKDLTRLYANHMQSRGDFPHRITNGPVDNYFVNTTISVGISTFNKKYIIGLDTNRSTTRTVTDVTAYFNGQPFHSVPISIAYTMDALLKQAMGNISHSITTRNHPLPMSLSDNGLNKFALTLVTGFVVSFTVIFGMSFLIASYVIFLIKERASGAKHLQKVSGVGSGAFWFSNFFWDMINYLIPVFLILIVFAAFNSDVFVKDYRLGLLFGMFLLFGCGSLPFVYFIQFVFKTAPAGMVAVSMLNILSGLSTLMAVSILRLPGLGTEDVASVLDWVFFIISPTYCLGTGIFNVYMNYGVTEVCKAAGYPSICLKYPTFQCCSGCTDICFKFQDNYLAWEYPGCGKYFVLMAVQGILFFLLLFLIESSILQQMFRFLLTKAQCSLDLSESQQENAEDSDVRDERERINTTDVNTLINSDSIVIKNLIKNYDNFLVVDNICVGIAQQECFGLLGQNGAGKTTTFKMLTGDVIPTSGNAWMNTHDIQHEIKTVHRNLGYCPQFDALIDQMTGRETLTMFARLRGVNEDQIKSVVIDLLHIMMLTQYADKECGTYSGGNKRKLSTAIALIGDPQFVFLDEPTTGMDPAARRQLWNVLSQVRASGRTLVLTSHSMEECDALCTKMVIMVNGRFVCCGSSQHLKNKFGQGYTLICNMGNDEDGARASAVPLKQYLCHKFPSTKIFDDHQGYCHFQIIDKNVSLGLLFGAMENAKKKFNVEDYAIHQATLEQVFLTFTRNQVPPKEVKHCTCRVMCCCIVCSC